MERLKVLTLLLGMVFVLSSCGKEEDNDSDSLTDKLKSQGITFKLDRSSSIDQYTGYSSDILSINCSDNSKSSECKPFRNNSNKAGTR